MITIKVAICDNDENHAKRLQEMLRQYAAENDLSFYINTFESTTALISETSKYELVYINMLAVDAKPNAIEAAEILISDALSPLVIFFVEDDSFVSEGYKAKLFRYWQKPAHQGQVFDDLNSAMPIFRKTFSHIRINRKSGCTLLPVTHIIYIEGKTGYQTIYTKKNRFKTSATLDEIYRDVCDRGFFKLSENCLINMFNVTQFQCPKIHWLGKHYIILQGGRKFAVTKSQVPTYEQAYLNFTTRLEMQDRDKMLLAYK